MSGSGVGPGGAGAAAVNDIRLQSVERERERQRRRFDDSWMMITKSSDEGHVDEDVEGTMWRGNGSQDRIVRDTMDAMNDEGRNHGRGGSVS